MAQGAAAFYQGASSGFDMGSEMGARLMKAKQEAETKRQKTQVDAENDAGKLAIDQQKADTDVFKAETDRVKVLTDAQKEAATIQFRKRHAEWMSQPVDLGRITMFSAQNPYMKNLTDYVLTNVDNGVYKTKNDAYSDMKSVEQLLIEGARDAINKEMEKNKNNPAALEKLSKQMNTLRPGFVDSMFGITPETAPILFGQDFKNNEGFTLGQGQARYDAAGNQIASVAAKADTPNVIKTWQTPDGNVVNLPNNVLPPEGSVPLSDSTEIESTTTSPDGTTSTFRIKKAGKSKKQDFTIAARGQLDKDLLAASEGRSRLYETARTFRPEFQEVGTRWNSMISAAKEKVGINLNPQEKKLLTDISEYKRTAFSNLNNYIKSVTGAAMTEAEAKRIMKGMPNPGDGLLNGDSPTEYQAKLESVLRELDKTVARLHYIRSRGDVTINDVSLEEMPGIMDQRGDEIFSEITARNPNLPETEVNKLVSSQLANEFGLLAVP